MRAPAREIGHGALAERALAPMMPAEEQFPYTVRVVSDISSRTARRRWRASAEVALDDGRRGAMKAPVAGIAMGLVMNEETASTRC